MSPHIINGANGHSATNGHSTTNGFHPVNGASSSHKPVRDGFSTRAIHVGSEPSSETGAVIPAISLSTTYKQDRVGVHKVRVLFVGAGEKVSRLGDARSALSSPCMRA
jgi:cystathionine gamma-lyase